MQKLATLLGLRERTKKTFDAAIDDLLAKFKNKQSLFAGIRKTYNALEGFADDPTKRGYVHVSSTVKEQFDWFREHSQNHLANEFSIEATNAKGLKANLIVDGQDMGEYSTLELLRLKTILDGKIQQVFKEIPVRKETVIWKPTKDENYQGRDVYETDLEEEMSKTTLKEQFILNDPHAGVGNRAPIQGQKDTQVNIGKATTQFFTGEWSMRQRADIQVRYNKLYEGVIAALEKANSAEVTTSNLGEVSFGYLFGK